MTNKKNIITKAYCHNGHSLINEENKISEYPSINLLVSDGTREAMTFLSTIEGEYKKKTTFDYPNNTNLKVLCPVCKEELDNIVPCNCVNQSKVVAIYLSTKRSFNECVGICNCWNCYNFFLNSAWKIISSFADNAK